jgi:hypothetical protein
MLYTSLHVVYARSFRPRVTLYVAPVPAGLLAAGDSVFLETDRGLSPIGEVRSLQGSAPSNGNGTGEADTPRSPSEHVLSAVLSVTPEGFERLNASVRATCWRTPLDAEATIAALLPPRVRQEASAILASDWARHEQEVVALWQPIVTELVTVYLDAIRDDLAQALREREDQLWDISRRHGERLAADWPVIQERLAPIIQTHLTPVLSRQLNDALSEAPKVRIAWTFARGRYREAFQHMLDWASEYLAAMSDSDRREMSEAVRAAWEAVLADPVITDRFVAAATRLRDDEELREAAVAIYRQAISENPHTAAFLRERVFAAPHVQEAFYDLTERLGPTIQRVAGVCLFDEEGTTRPEVVHVLRSTALDRRVAWVTLSVVDPTAPPLMASATIPAATGAGDE